MIGAIVSRGGRPDLAGPALPRVRAPTLLIVGGNDTQVIQLNRMVLPELRCEKTTRDHPRGYPFVRRTWSLDEVARLAREWFERHLRSAMRHFTGRDN